MDHPLLNTEAPEFSLLDQEGNEVTLGAVLPKHKLVLVFYPGDETPGCTAQLCAIRDEWVDFQAANIMVYGVNPGDAESHTKFWRHHGLKTPLLVDAGLKVAEKYAAVQNILGKKIIHRTVVLVDQQGIIRYYHRGMPAPKEIIAAAQNV